MERYNIGNVTYFKAELLDHLACRFEGGEAPPILDGLDTSLGNRQNPEWHKKRIIQQFVPVLRKPHPYFLGSTNQI